MVEAHERKANAAAGLWIITLIALVVILTGYDGNIWENGDWLTMTAVSVHAATLFAALWFYAKAKGYWGILGASLFFLSYVGLAILLCLPDRSIHQPKPPA